MISFQYSLMFYLPSRDEKHQNYTIVLKYLRRRDGVFFRRTCFL